MTTRQSPTSARPRPPRDWVSKTLAGLLLGFCLAMGCSGLFERAVSDLPLAVRGQLAMWLVAPIWMGVLGGVYFFSSGRRAWLWLAGANVLVIGLLAAWRLA